MENIFSLYYQRYKRYLLSTGIIVVAIFIVARVLLPEFTNIQEIRTKMEEKNTTLSNLNSTLSLLMTLSDDTVASNLSTANAALPPTKEFLAVYKALVYITAKTNVQLQAFSSKVGTIYRIDKKYNESQAVGKEPSFEVQAEITSPDLESLRSFVEEIHEILPLADIRTLEAGQSAGSYKLFFFYKPVNADSLKAEDKLNPLSPQQQSILDDVQQKKQTQESSIVPLPQVSPESSITPVTPESTTPTTQPTQTP